MASGGEGGQQQEQNKLKEVITGSATYEGETNGGMKHGMGTLTWDDGDQVRPWQLFFLVLKHLHAPLSFVRGRQRARPFLPRLSCLGFVPCLLAARLAVCLCNSGGPCSCGCWPLESCALTGSQYVGEFKFDEKTNGTFRWKGGDTYTGEWKSSLMHGKGTYTYKNGRMYEGSWEEGYKQGLGVFTWPNEDKYAGEFYKDMCHGVGILYYADGRVYKGNWQQNKKHGYVSPLLTCAAYHRCSLAPLDCVVVLLLQRADR